MNKSLLVLLTLPALLQAQETTVIPELNVSAPPLADVRQVGLDTSIATGLQTLPGVIVLPQGLPGGQSDFSIRGSNFSGAGLSLAGLSLRNAQTEHFHAELPFPGNWLGAPEVLTGARQAAETEGHLTGTVALTPLPVSNRITATAGADNKDGLWSNLSAQRALSREQGTQLGIGAFAGWMDVPGVDLPDNDVELTRGGVQIQRLTTGAQTDLWVGHQDKTFGVRGYYGVNPAFDATERTRDTLALLSTRSLDPARIWDAAIAFRRFEDEYKLFLPTSLYRNHHTTDTLAAQAGGVLHLTETLSLRHRIAADRESIDSNSLGDFDRSRLGLTALPVWAMSPSVRLMAGARAELLEGDPDRLLPIVRSELDASKALTFHAEYSQSVRRPSYTELNYESPGSLGNSGLGLQDQESAEAGLTWKPATDTRLSATVFRQQTYDTVDWIRPNPAATRWLAANIGRVDTTGIELDAEHRLSSNLIAGLGGLALDKDAENAPYASRYALDYARYFLRARLDWTPVPWLRLEAQQFWRQQEENVLRVVGGDEQWLTQLAAHVRVHERIQLSLMAHNALNDDYRLYPGQDTVTGRRVSCALTVDW